MSSERADQPATPSSQHGNPGQVLASQREALGWTVEQVADQLKLAVRQVVALEAGDYASLPSPAVTRGFVRAYAKLMKLDPAPLVAQIAIDTGPVVEGGAVNAPRRAQPASFSQSSRFPSHGKRSKLPLGLIGAVVVVVAAGAAAWHFGVVPSGQHADATVAAPAHVETAPGSATETLQNPSVPLISVPGTTPSTAGAPAAGTTATPGAAAPAQPTVTTPAPTAAAPVAATPAAPAPAPTATPATPAAPAAAPAGANALVLNVREDSWIEVRPAKGGAALISRLVKGGSLETVNVDGPVRVVVGNPTGVTATLRGAPVALPPVPGKTISRVNLE